MQAVGRHALTRSPSRRARCSPARPFRPPRRAGCGRSSSRRPVTSHSTGPSSDVTVLSSYHRVARCFSAAADAFSVCNPAAQRVLVRHPVATPSHDHALRRDAVQIPRRRRQRACLRRRCAPGSGAYCLQVTRAPLRHAFHCEAIVSSVEPLIRALRN
jgi:hypothetical protein